VKIFLYIVFFFNIFCCKIFAEHTRMLNSDWEFRQAGKEEKWMRASVPGSIYLDLVQARVIPDPLVFDHEGLAAFVGKSDWEYRHVFQANPEDLKHLHAELSFEGLDTRADVFLNDSLIIKADNMFLPWKKEIRSLIRPGQNVIRVLFYSPLREASERQKQNHKRYPGGERTFLRKAAYQFGWDWAPALPAGGLWKPVSIHFWSEFRVSDLMVHQTFLSDSLGIFTVSFHTHAERDTILTLKLSLNNQSYSHERIKVKKGHAFQERPVRVPFPKRWWCREMGDAVLYKVGLEISDPMIWRQDFMRGFRTVTIDRNYRSAGQGFRILLNNKPVYIKGANYVPPSPFPGNIRPETYRKSVALAAQTGINMLRVWGGGIYADSAFMEACGREGILVWHDFMFACAMVPFEAEMVKNIKDEITFQARRLASYPSLAVFCGNNEISEGWFNWGWQKEYNLGKDDSTQIWNQYTLLFHITLPSLLKSICPDIPYWESSPMTGWGRASAYLEGDVHYWGVWWGMEPFESYRQKTGRFVSEYGFQGTPEPRILKRMARKSPRSFDDLSLKVHQKHPRGFETIQSYAERYFPKPKDFNAQWYIASIQQAYAMEMAISSHRSRAPFNMGTLFWQWNDCWPSVSWSVLDESMQAKAAWYTVKREYLPVHLDLSGKYGDYIITASLSGAESLKGTLRYEFMKPDGKVLFNREKEVNLSPSASSEVFRFSDPFLMKMVDTTLHHVRISFITDGKTLAQCSRLLCRPAQLKLGNPNVQCKVVHQSGHDDLIITAQSFAPWLGITTTVPGQFSDNYFHLEPGEVKVIRFKPQAKPLKPLLYEIQSLYDVTDHSPSPQH
jgi:beta-mannosidase